MYHISKRIYYIFIEKTINSYKTSSKGKLKLLL